MKVKKEKVIAAYKSADEAGKTLLISLFGSGIFSVTERIKTFEDACKELGNDHPLVKSWNSIYQGENADDISDIADILANHKLRIICAALNEGLEPKFTRGEARFFPWFYLYTNDKVSGNDEHIRHMDTCKYENEYGGLAYVYSYNSPSGSSASVGSHLCLRSLELAEYCGKQFIDIWADFLLIRN